MRDELEMQLKSVTREDKTAFRSWMIIVGIAVLFLCYGLFMFFAVGDKGPPGWDFGVVEDIPGESPYSTHPGGAEPDAQHVSQKPPQSGIDVQKENP